MERKKRSKGRGWESCYVKKFTGRLVSKWERTGRNWSNFARTHTHTHTHTRARAAKLVVEIKSYIYLKLKCKGCLFTDPKQKADILNRQIPTRKQIFSTDSSNQSSQSTWRSVNRNSEQYKLWKLTKLSCKWHLYHELWHTETTWTAQSTQSNRPWRN